MRPELVGGLTSKGEMVALLKVCEYWLSKARVFCYVLAKPRLDLKE